MVTTVIAVVLAGQAESCFVIFYCLFFYVFTWPNHDTSAENSKFSTAKYGKYLQGNMCNLFVKLM